MGPVTMTSLCNREEEVVAAVINGQISPSIAKHLDSCENCKAAANVTMIFQADAACAHENTFDIHSADMIWMKAVFELRTRQKRRQRLGKTIGVFLGILVACLMGLAISPSNTTFSFDQFQAPLSLILPLLLILTSVFLTVSLVVYAFQANRLTTGK